MLLGKCITSISVAGDRLFLRIPCWLVFLPCSLPTDSWLVIIIPVETKRNFDLTQAAWAHSHVLPSNQSAK